MVESAHKRVLHAAWGFGGASETFIGDRMLMLDRLGWEAWVAAKWVVPNPMYEFPDRPRVLEPTRREALAARFRPGPLRREAWWLDRPIRRLRPDLVHAHFGWTAAEALEATKRHGIPLVAGFHGYDATVYPKYGFGAPEKPGRRPNSPGSVYGDLLREADMVLATSRFIAKKLKELGVEAPVEVVPSGIRLERFPFRGPRPGDGELRLVFVGRLVPYKGLDVALRALASLRREGSGPLAGASLVVVGEGPMRGEWEELARSLGVAGQVDFRGVQSRDGVYEAIAGADILVMPSRTTAAGQAEGLGNVVKEALAVGLEVAVSDNGGLREVMPVTRTSELVAENDAEALAARIEAILNLRPHWEARAREGREWVEQTYDWRNLAPRIGDVYRRAIESHG